jgi:hypothetical protein
VPVSEEQRHFFGANDVAFFGAGENNVDWQTSHNLWTALLASSFNNSNWGDPS